MEHSSKTTKTCSRLSCVMNQDPKKYCDSQKKRMHYEKITQKVKVDVGNVKLLRMQSSVLLTLFQIIYNRRGNALHPSSESDQNLILSCFTYIGMKWKMRALNFSSIR